MRRAVVYDGALSLESGDVPAPWWSVTKTVIATAALVLVEQGRMSLDVPLENRPFTLRQLLQHTSGLPDYGGLAAYHDAVRRAETPWSFDELWRKSEADRLLFEPGAGWRYSNIGYALVRAEIERVTRQNLGEALQRLVFAPLGVEDAQVAATPGDLAKAHVEALAGYHPGWVYHGLVVGPLTAAARFLWALTRGALVGADTFAMMRTPLRLDVDVGERPWKQPGYGLGLMVNGEQALPCWGHTGQGPGCVVAAYFFPMAQPVAVTVFRETADQGVVESEAVELARARQELSS